MKFALVLAFALAALVPEPADARRISWGRRRQLGRGGRQEEDAAAAADVPAAPPLPLAAGAPEEDDEAAAATSDDGLPDGCNYTKPKGAWMNFWRWRKWCADNGHTSRFGPYGGIPKGKGGDDETSAAGGNGAAAANQPVPAGGEAQTGAAGAAN